jgi:hypothetical protein
MQGARVLILSGEFQGHEGICVGQLETRHFFAVSPDHSDEIIELAVEKDFGLLVDLSADPTIN